MEITLSGKRWAKAIPGLLPREVRVFIALATRADAEGAVEIRRTEFVAEMGLCPITLRRALHGLATRGMIWVGESQHGGGAILKLVVLKKWVTIQEAR